ncbi:hypothetical protein JDN40_00195, partial [Rhodomicrobium vannielii ATCC 17100]|nr:hypothetical protein [Rhodomicrobium vannielii ATCC 17100]
MSTTNKPTHRVYAVTKGGKKQSFWREIGAAWAHEDGQGLNIVLDCLPWNGA